MSDTEDRKAFMEATRGVDAWTVGRAMRLLTPGIDWRGSPKGRIAEMWANARNGTIRVYPQMAHVTLEALRAQIEKLS